MATAPSSQGAFKPAYVEQARRLAMLGMADEKIAMFFDVSLAELAQWAFDDAAFYNAITPSALEREEWPAKRLESTRRRSVAKQRRMQGSAHERTVNRMRARMWSALKGKSSGGYLARFGYSAKELKEHLERQFLPGMNWENYGKWHVDHIRPCVSFDLSDDEQLAECWALANLQPLWASDNIRKGVTHARA